MNWLTVRLVEEIQHAFEKGIDVCPFVAALEAATLPAVVEYGCLRWAARPANVPPLPQSVTSSDLGCSLSEVRSDLGLRSSGPQKQPTNSLQTKRIEFCVLKSEADLDDRWWNLFEIRFDRSAQSVGFPAKIAHGLQAALHEMAENAVMHSAISPDVLVGYRVIDGTAQFSVADAGIGVLESLRTCPDFQHLQLHVQAIREAYQDGTSRFGRNKSGLGFRKVFKALAQQWGVLRFRSGEGCITMDGTGLDADQGEQSFPPFLPGFQVTVCCRTSEAFPPEPLV